MPTNKVKEPKSTVKNDAVKPVSKTAGLSVGLYGVDGAKKGALALPKEIFGAKVNEELMKQAIRVYMVNQRQGTASTKTRGEVTGSTRKIYRQKGTGRARHGAKSAPIFVGGGVALGPHPRNFELKLSKQMRKKALFSALSLRVKEEKISGVDIAGFSGKTREVASMLKTLSMIKKRKADKVLFVSSDENALRATRNIEGVIVAAPHAVNIYEVLNSNYLLLTKEAVEKMEGVFLKTEKN